MDSRTNKNNSWGTFLRHKYSIDIKSVLDKLNLKHERKGDYLYFICPYHKDNNPSISIHTSRNSNSYGLFQCWSCGVTGNIIDLIIDISSISSVDKINEFLNDSSLEVDEWKLLIEENSLDEKTEKIVDISLPKSFREIKENDKFHNYIIKRNLSFKTIERYDIGGCISGRYKDRIIIPVFYKNNLVSFCARSIYTNNYIKKNQLKKILYPYGTKLTQLLFPDIINVSDFSKAYLVEGVLDVLRMRELGYKNVFTTFSNKVTDKQASLLNRFKKIIAVPDGDEGGDVLLNCLQNTILYNKIFYCALPQGEDPNSMNKNELKKKLNNVVKQNITKRYLIK